METTKVGIREFRDNLATYVLESETPVAITRHGDTVGFFIPTRRKRTNEERENFREAHAKLQAVLKAKGIAEDDILADFEKLRSKRRV